LGPANPSVVRVVLVLSEATNRMDFDDLDDAVGGRMYDVIIFGATGYTGCLMVEHLDAVLSTKDAIPHKWCLAGRDEKKLKTIASKCKTEPNVMAVNSNEDYETMAELCHVIIAAAGPYDLCGTPVIKACIEKKTHYIDVTGEVVWMRKMIDTNHQAAKEAGVQIVQCAGAMCALDDINLYLLLQKGPLKDFREYSVGTGFTSGGTFFTGYKQYDGMMPHEFENVHLNPFALGGTRECGLREEDKDQREAVADSLYPNIWKFPGHSTHAAVRICRRTVQLFEESPDDGINCGKEITVGCYNCTMDEKTAVRMVKGNQGPQDVKDLIKFTMTMEAMSSTAPPRGGGPPAAARATCYTEAYSVAEREDGEWVHVHYEGPEGYEVTAMSAVNGALCMLEEAELLKPKERGGVLTPAFAFHGSTWIERLGARPFGDTNNRMMKFEVRDGKPSQEEMDKVVFGSDTAGAYMADLQRKKAINGWAPPEIYDRTI